MEKDCFDRTLVKFSSATTIWNSSKTHVREPVSSFVSGNRFGSILDPFGVQFAEMM